MNISCIHTSLIISALISKIYLKLHVKYYITKICPFTKLYFKNCALESSVCKLALYILEAERRKDH